MTAARLVLIPIVVLLLARSQAMPGPWDGARVAAIAVFVLVAITDWVDGYLARSLGATTRWGSVADAAADRLALLAPLGFLALREPAGFAHVPLWIPGWLIALDAVAGVAWAVARWRAGVPAPGTHNQAGRIGAALLFLLVLCALIGVPAWAIVLLAVAGLGLVTASAARHVRRFWSDRP